MVAAIVQLVFSGDWYQVPDASLQIPVVYSMNINLVSINERTVQHSSHLKAFPVVRVKK
jgi:hypothetical protein